MVRGNAMIVRGKGLHLGRKVGVIARPTGPKAKRPVTCPSLCICEPRHVTNNVFPRHLPRSGLARSKSGWGVGDHLLCRIDLLDRCLITPIDLQRSMKLRKCITQISALS